MGKLLEHQDGKMKTTLSVFGAALATFLFSWFIIFGLGGAIGVSIGITVAVFSLAISIMFGILSVVLYLDWVDNG
jgi:hypothetical protein